MKKAVFFAIVFTLISFLVFKNLNKPERAYYYWKSQWVINEEHLIQLENQKINKIFIKFFDVVWSEKSNSIDFIAPIHFKSKWPNKIQMIPVVFIENKLLQNEENLNSLSDTIFSKINSLSQKLSWDELQIDCDWSLSTKNKYFHLLNLLRQKIGNKKISATIRLHQIKYSDITGVPPVNYGSLMLYNMGELKAESDDISIFNLKDTQKYIKYLKKYKLKLDLALPIFSWYKVIRNNKIISLLSNVDDVELLESGLFIKNGENLVMLESNFFRGRYFLKDDILKIEKVNPELIKLASQIANQNKNSNFRSVVLFDFNQSNLINFTSKDINEIFNIF